MDDETDKKIAIPKGRARKIFLILLAVAVLDQVFDPLALPHQANAVTVDRFRLDLNQVFVAVRQLGVDH